MMDSTLENSGDPRELAEVVVKILKHEAPALALPQELWGGFAGLGDVPREMVDLIYRLLPLMARN
ncbi:MAG: hypothetical protein U1U88_001084 [Lawsonella clevelandensis]